jgi:hypothetical protein
MVLIWYIITECLQIIPLIFLSFGTVFSGHGSEELAIFAEGVGFEIDHSRCRFFSPVISHKFETLWLVCGSDS